MLGYLIKSTLCLLVLWGFYKIALEQTAAHHFKRFYLLGSLIIALALPLITLSYTVAIAPQPTLAETTGFEPVTFTENAVQPVEEPTNWLPISLGIIYASGVLLFGFRFLRNLIRLRRKINNNENVPTKSHINVLLVEKVIPHSFLRFIFLPKKDFKNNAIAPEVLQHEQAHVTQKHSWDILFIEILQVVLWFNPLLLLLKKSIALNHEFLADQAALENNNTIENYTNLLFTYSGGAHHTALSSPINYSLTKKRILMLSKTRSVKKLAERLALFVPVLALCVYFFNQEIVAKPLQKADTSILGKWVELKTEFAQLKIFNEGKQLWMKFAKDTFELRKEGDNRYTMIWKNKPFSAKNEKLSLIYKPENNELLLGENSFIRPENTYGKLFAGDWEGVDVDQDFFIRSGNGNTSWVIKEPFGTFEYYPVITPDGFYFTYDNIDTYFTVDGDIMTSSAGHHYKKVREAPKTLTIYIHKDRVSVNGYPATIDSFKKSIDLITKDWSEVDFKNYQLTVKIGTSTKLNKYVLPLDNAFRQTRLYSKNDSQVIMKLKELEPDSAIELPIKN